MVNLKGITLGVESGEKPFNTSAVGDLYVPSDKNPTSIAVSLKPTVSYMQLPLGQCEALAQFLPVTFNSDLSLFTWNQEDPMYETIINTPSFIEFSFESTGSDEFRIKVPFSVLDLTLESPIVSTSTPHFPCKSVDSKENRYFLGRAFLQASYLAIHWPINSFYLAHAAGPDSGEPEIAPFDQTGYNRLLGSIDNTFLSTWQSRWNKLSASENGTAIPSVSSSAMSPSSPGFAGGAKAGIAFSVIIIIASIVAALFIFVRRRKVGQQEQRLELPATGLDIPKPVYMRTFSGYWRSLEEKRLPPVPVNVLAQHEMATPYNIHRNDCSEADSRESVELPLKFERFEKG